MSTPTVDYDALAKQAETETATPAQPANRATAPTAQQTATTSANYDALAKQAENEIQQSQTRQSMVAGLTGMPTPNMSDADKATFEKGKAAGAVSNVAATSAMAGGAGIDAVLPAVLPHTVAGIKAISDWATAHPVQAYMLYNVVRELLPNAKKAIGLVKAVPTD